MPNNFESIKKGIEEHCKSFLKFKKIQTDRLIIRRMKLEDLMIYFVLLLILK